MRSLKEEGTNNLKWFKHHNDMLSKPYMQILLDKHGTAGVYAWIRLLEVLAEHFDIEKPGIFVESKRNIYTEIFPCVGNKTGKKILDFFQLMTDFSYTIDGKTIVINCPEIRRLADNFTRKALKNKEEEKG